MPEWPTGAAPAVHRRMSRALRRGLPAGFEDGFITVDPGGNETIAIIKHQRNGFEESEALPRASLF